MTTQPEATPATAQQPTPDDRRQHIFLVAFEVYADSRERAERELLPRLAALLPSTFPDSPVESWWVAEDDRHDGSDNDSAVFCNPGDQEAASSVLMAAGLTAHHNIITGPPTRFEPTLDGDEVNDLLERVRRR